MRYVLGFLRYFVEIACYLELDQSLSDLTESGLPLSRRSQTRTPQ